MQPANPGVRRRSPWLYVAFGCGGLATVALLVGGFTLFAMWQGLKARGITEDPASRLEEVKRILGAKQLPEGYQPAMLMSVPLVSNTVLLTRERPNKLGAVPGGIQHGFTYYLVRTAPRGDEPLLQYIQGHDPAPGSTVDVPIRLRVYAVLARGTLSFPGRTVRYASQRGRFPNEGKNHPEGLSALVLFECPQDPFLRAGIWFTPDPAPDAPAGAPALAGTPADEEAVRAFVSHFNPCQES